METKNCWKFMKCGRHPEGENINTTGICPVSTEKKYNQTNHGKNTGRCCWQIADTNQVNTLKKSPVFKLIKCLDCDFFKKVKTEEKENFSFLLKDHTR